MSADHEAAFRALREVLVRHAAGLSVSADTPERYCLDAAVGPATLAAWGGKRRRPTIPVAWVERGSLYVSYHLMGIGGNAPLVAGLSPRLRARMQGKTCFNFGAVDAGLFAELEAVTAASIAGMRRAGFIAD